MQDEVSRAQSRLGASLRSKYRLDKILGVGGMGIVYKATHRNRAEFAIKMLLPELSSDPDTRARFLREGYAANSVKHPGVVAIVDDDVAEDGAAFLVMELLDGLSVEDLASASGGTLPPAIVSAIAYQLLDVLTVAHAAGIVHRDLKPANLFVTTTGQLKVLDFGIARVRDALMLGAQATQSGITFGTPAFMSPEQAGGRTRDVDERSDIWAVGATMYTLLSGRLVHEAADGQALMVKAATSRARPVALVAPKLPPEIAPIVDRALAFEKGQRWSSAGEMRDALLRAHQACFGEPPLQAKLQAFCVAASTADVPGSSGAAATRVQPLKAGAPGVSTTKGVSSDKHARARARIAVAAVAVGAIAFSIALAFFVNTKLHPARAPVEGTEPAVPATEPMPKVSVAPPVEPPPIASPSVEPSLPAPSASAAPSVARGPKTKPKPGAAAPAVTSPQKPNCEPPYTFDAEGNKHFKKECY